MATEERYHALEDFANFVAHEIFDVEWDYNCTKSFPELACRKLLKLGIISGNKYNYIFVETKHDKDKAESWILLEKEKIIKIKAIIDNWAVDDDEHELLEQIADIIDEEVNEAEDVKD
jgi:hypothetical protein